MNKEQLLLRVDELFPAVAKPQGLELSFHKDDCLQCEFFRKVLENISSKVFPESAIRKIYDELSCLSAKGFRWVMPTYLRHVLNTQNSLAADEIEIEFFIYNFSPELKYQKDAILRAKTFDIKQIECIKDVLSWLNEQYYWQDYCGEELNSAVDFMRTLSAQLDAEI